MKKPRVLLSEDHAIVAEGLRSLLEDTVDLIGTVGDGRAMLETASRLRPDVIVADISMPVLNGLDATRQLKTLGIPSKIIFLTMHADLPVARQAFRAGASGFLLKHSASHELISAIHTVLDGGLYITPILTSNPTQFLLEVSQQSDLEAISLTPRRREVLQLIAEGRTMKEVAAILNISSRTAESHKYGLMERLGVRTTAELVQYAIRLGLVEIPIGAIDSEQSHSRTQS